MPVPYLSDRQLQVLQDTGVFPPEDWDEVPQGKYRAFTDGTYFVIFDLECSPAKQIEVFPPEGLVARFAGLSIYERA